MAESAEPGDMLYTVKTTINEPVLASLQSEAEWEASAAIRRGEEMHDLALEGKLSADVRADLQQKFEAHANRSIELVEAANGETTVENRAELITEFDQEITAMHESFVRLARDSQGDTAAQARIMVSVLASTKSEIAQLKAGMNIETNTDMDSSMSESEESMGSGRTESTLEATERWISELRTDLEARADVQADIRADLESRLNTAAEATAEARVRLQENANAAAQALSTQASSIASEVRVWLHGEAETEEKMHMDIDHREEDEVELESSTDSDVSAGSGDDDDDSTSVRMDTSLETSGSVDLR